MLYLVVYSLVFVKFDQLFRLWLQQCKPPPTAHPLPIPRFVNQLRRPTTNDKENMGTCPQGSGTRDRQDTMCYFHDLPIVIVKSTFFHIPGSGLRYGPVSRYGSTTLPVYSPIWAWVKAWKPNSPFYHFYYFNFYSKIFIVLIIYFYQFLSVWTNFELFYCFAHIFNGTINFFNELMMSKNMYR